MHVVAILLKTSPKKSCSFCEPMSFKILHQILHQIFPIKAMYSVPGLIALKVCEILEVNLKNNIYDKSIINFVSANRHEFEVEKSFASGVF